MKSEEREEEEDLHCTAPRCRKVLPYGDGNQWVREGTMVVERYCISHWCEMIRDAKDLRGNKE